MGSVEHPNYSDLLSLMECPVCLLTMKPNIHICQNGHSVCGSCKATLALCPVCQDKFPYIRNLLAEELFNKMRQPCKNQPFGCEEQFLVGDLVLHENKCRHKLIECKAVKFSNGINLLCCEWAGKYDSIFEHVKNSHELCAVNGLEGLSIYKGKDGVYPSFYLVKDYDELFWTYSKIDSKGNFRLAVFVIGTEPNAKKFQYQVKCVSEFGPNLDFINYCHSDTENFECLLQFGSCFSYDAGYLDKHFFSLNLYIIKI